MFEHLVRGHLGGYYISSSDPEFIESYCEQCGDYDEILASWDTSEENARVNALLKYFLSETLNTREDIDNEVEKITKYYDVETEDIIPSLLDQIDYKAEDTYSIASCLHEDREISNEEFEKIMKISKFEEDRQNKMVKHFANSMFTKDESGNVKVLKLGSK